MLMEIILVLVTVKRHCLVIPNDLQIYLINFNNSVIVESGGGNLLLGGTHTFKKSGLNTVLANFSTPADLYYNGTKKFETQILVLQ